jgi:hypothetical protein
MAHPSKDSLSSHEDIIISSPSEERKGLLSGVDTLSLAAGADETNLSPLCGGSTLLSFGLARIMVVFGALLGVVLGVFYWLSSAPNSINTLHFNGDTLRSNGTHEFKRTVLLVSIDGLRDALSNSPRRLILSPLTLRTGPTI